MLRQSLATVSSLVLLKALAAGPLAAFELRPGIVVDREPPAIYLMNPERGIDAVDPTTGALLWTSREAARPLAVSGELLVAQAEPAGAGVLKIAVLDRSDGSLRSTLDVGLPEGVTGRVADGLGTKFGVWALADKGQIQIGWEEVRRWTRPIPPGPDDALVSRLKSGALIDLAEKSVRPLTVAPERPAAPIVRLASDEGTGARLRADQVLAATRTLHQMGRERLVLQRWQADTNAPLTEVGLVEGAYHLRLPSVDRRHLLVSRETAPGTGDGYTFLIFSLETGERLGEVKSRRSHAFFFVLGNTFVYESPPYARRDDDGMVSEPLQLRAVDLWRGIDVWRRPVRDLRYLGPFPP